MSAGPAALSPGQSVGLNSSFDQGNLPSSSPGFPDLVQDVDEDQTLSM